MKKRELNFSIYSLVTLTRYLLTLASCYLLQVKGVQAQSNWNMTGSADGDKPAEFKDLETVFANILNILVAFAGVAVFVMFIMGGYRLMFSGGDPQKAGQAKATLTWAVIGLVFLLGTWLILRFIEQFTGVKVSLFCIPAPGKECGATTSQPYLPIITK